jgi:hypothetical protein
LQTRQQSEDAMPESHRIKVKFGDAEFEAEGAEDKVQAQYDQFLAALERVGPRPAPKTENRSQTPQSLDDASMARIFQLREDDLVVLKVHPPETMNEADRVTLLLYGCRRLKNQEHVLATQLLRAARLSGLGLDRIDRAVESYIPEFVMREGQRKGTTYNLTTRGMTKAQEVAAVLLG